MTIEDAMPLINSHVETTESALLIAEKISRRAVLPGIVQALDSGGLMLKIYFISHDSALALATSGVMFAVLDWAMIAEYIITSSTALLSVEYSRRSHLLKLKHQQTRIKEIESTIGAIQQQNRLAALLLSIPPAIVLFFYTTNILKTLGVDDGVADTVADFTNYAAFALPGMLMRVAEYSFLYSINKEDFLSIVMLADIVLGVILTGLLVPGYLGLPQLGVKGSGIAALLQSIIICTMLFTYSLQNKDIRLFKLYEIRPSNNLRYTKEIITLGLPLIFTSGIANLSELVRNILVGNLGAEYLEISQTYMSWSYVVTSLVCVFAKVGGIEVGQQLGLNRFHQLKIVGNTSTLLCLGIITPAIVLAPLLSAKLSSVFLSEALIDSHKDLLSTIFLLAFVTNAFYGTQNSINENLKNLKDTLFTSVTTVASYVLVGLTLAYLSVKVLDLGLIGLESSYCLTFAINTMLFSCYWANRTTRAIETNSAPPTSNTEFFERCSI